MDASDDRPRIRIAIIGAGLIGPRHAQHVIANHDTELVAVVDPSPAGRRLAEELEVCHYPSTTDLIASGDVLHAAIICTPNDTHSAVAMQLSSAGIHLLIEKPLAADTVSAEALVAQLAQSQTKVLVGHHRRFSPCIIAAKAALEAGSLGQIIAINGLWTLYKPQAYFDPPSDWRRGDAGGVVLINMIHEVDLLHHLFGPIARVHAEAIAPQRDYRAEEGAAMTLRFRSGAVGTFLISDATPSPFNFESGTGENPLIPKTGKDFYRIFGTEGTLSVPDMVLWHYKGSVPKSWHSPLTGRVVPTTAEVPFAEQLAAFLPCGQGRGNPKLHSRSRAGGAQSLRGH
ncbi:hypothetical protein JDV02_009616 [Purpureocillium takamizusanense]|uniref:Quinate utilization oxidoreductase QutH n=1 Tax=Purpureocillium takamizusanense TaxID=2060973 RepID=A0A9Q8QQB5_9HYPO|nr:uncharacterized protein JDV02_009616 [Purpureocillium takamizusanense]UNI23820.1 hypothetical protein JDV02_009616 [Purpureocillium takamizusanense]